MPMKRLISAGWAAWLAIVLCALAPAPGFGAEDPPPARPAADDWPWWRGPNRDDIMPPGPAAAAAMGAAGRGLLAAPATAPAGFRRRGFYLHGSWVFNYPFAVRTWKREDFAGMFRVLRLLGFDTVMMWPTLEAAPMPLSDADAAAIRAYRDVIADAQKARLTCWIASCPCVISGEQVRPTPWAKRSLYASMKTVRLDSPQADAYLRHRQAVVRLLDNADALVVIDGDPGGWAGAPPEAFVRLLRGDMRAMGTKPVIPWIWNGWGRDCSKGGFWAQPVEPHTRACLEALKAALPPGFELMPGRSHRDGHANGRVNIQQADKAGLIAQSTLMCYEAIEFEPSPPAAVLQFDLIRKSLREEAGYAPVARGVFGNAQQPIMVLPNLFFFARAAADLRYLDRSDADVLSDLAAALGGPADMLVPAWSCLARTLADLPADLPARLRSLKLDSELARSLPGGPARYVEILAAQVASRRGVLEAAAEKPADAAQAAATLARGAAAAISWWNVHRYVGAGNTGDPFAWQFLHHSLTGPLRDLARRCNAMGERGTVVEQAANLLARRDVLPPEQTIARLTEIAGK